MILFAVSYFAGMLTIVSPCILPVLPFVFARAEQPFLRSGLPMLVGMAFTFAGVATLAAVGGSWAVRGERVWPPGGHRAARGLRPDLAGPRACRVDDPAAGRRRCAAFPIDRAGRASARRRRAAVVPARHRDRPALGALRRSDPRADPDRRGAGGRERRHHPAAARLCGRCCDVARAGAAGRRPRVRRHEDGRSAPASGSVAASARRSSLASQRSRSGWIPVS